LGAEEIKWSYTYPNLSDDPDRIDVLRNKKAITSQAELRTVEYAATDIRQMEIRAGNGPAGKFDKAHLKALHRHIFQDVYEWAGHTRNESPMVDGRRVEPIGMLSKGGMPFLPGSRIDMGLDEAFRPISDLRVLKGSSARTFAGLAGKVLAELNYVHPFREGNGRAQEAFIFELGRKFGHEADFTVITRARMIEASIETANNPASEAMQTIVLDAVDPLRREALRRKIDDMLASGKVPWDQPVKLD
jgi:cell filamentation protein